MKILYLLLCFSISFCQAKDYLFETGGIISNADEELIEYPDGAKFIVYKGNNGAWKDSEGDYGKEKCIGYVKTNINKNAEVHFRCEGANQNGEKFWNRLRIRPIFNEKNELIYFAGEQNPISVESVRRYTFNKIID